MNYEHKVMREIADWEQQMFKPPGWLEKHRKPSAAGLIIGFPEGPYHHNDHYTIDRAHGTVRCGIYA